MKLDFAFYVGGIEAAMVKLLKEGSPDLEQPGMTNVKDYATYSGELSRENLLVALKALAPRFPLVMVSYGSGKDRRKAPTGLDGDRIEIEHVCGFVVIVASNDLRGQKNRQTTAFQMIGEVRQLLGGVQFEITVEDEKELLNHSPMIPVAVETITRLPDLTAFAVHFETSFHEWLPDRRIVPMTIEEIEFEVFLENTNPPEFNLPGVTGE